MIVDIEKYKIIKEVDINQITIDVVSIDFLNNRSLFKVVYVNNEIKAEDSIKYIEVNNEEYTEWGSDDNYIINLILQKLNLIKK